MSIVHVFNILKMGLGILLLFIAVILWSISRRFSSTLLALTALLLYAQIVLDLLDYYGIIDAGSLIIAGEVPVLSYGFPILLILSLIVTLLVFIREERK